MTQKDYYIFLAGVSWAINNLDEDNSVRIDNRLEEIEDMINKIIEKQYE